MNAHFLPRIGEALVYLGVGIGMVAVQAVVPAHLEMLPGGAMAESVIGGSGGSGCDPGGGTLAWSPGSRANSAPVGAVGPESRPGFEITGLGSGCVGKRLQVTLRQSDGRVLGTSHARVSPESRGGGHRATFHYPALDREAADISSVQVHVAD